MPRGATEKRKASTFVELREGGREKTRAQQFGQSLCAGMITALVACCALLMTTTVSTCNLTRIPHSYAYLEALTARQHKVWTRERQQIFFFDYILPSYMLRYKQILVLRLSASTTVTVGTESWSTLPLYWYYFVDETPSWKLRLTNVSS